MGNISWIDFSLLQIKFNGRSKNRLLNNIMPTIGLMLCDLFILFFNKELNHPSLITLIPIIGTCLNYLVCKQKRNNYDNTIY